MRNTMAKVELLERVVSVLVKEERPPTLELCSGVAWRKGRARMKAKAGKHTASRNDRAERKRQRSERRQKNSCIEDGGASVVGLSVEK